MLSILQVMFSHEALPMNHLVNSEWDSLFLDGILKRKKQLFPKKWKRETNTGHIASQEKRVQITLFLQTSQFTFGSYDLSPGKRVAGLG